MDDETKKPRRARVDSIAGVADAIIAGGKKITPPPGITLDGKEGLIFKELCDELSKTEPTRHKVRLLAMLAKEIAALEREMAQLRDEGTVFTNSHGNLTANPRAKVVQSLNATVLSLRRSLGVHARELAGGDNRNTALRRAHNKTNEAHRDDYDGDNLITFPSPQQDDAE